MIVYVALVDKWPGCDGCDWNLVGVYDSFEEADEKLCSYNEKYFYTKIISVDLNADAHQYIGGYVQHP